ncbi:MAG: hypothetical protein P8R42_05285 [Candidatus Binatia bacterium]|nr:hypothetical protein [Candidatus Binatia bacterium]
MTDRLKSAHQTWLDAQGRVVEILEQAKQPGAPADWAEGYRWATRLASIALEWVVEKNDPEHPVMFLQQDAYKKFIVDNPDVSYHFCVLDDGQSYRLSGNRGEAPYVGLTFGSDIFHWGQGGGGGGTLAQSNLDDFEIADDGTFEITISRERCDGNWVEMVPEIQHLAVRETFFDKETQRGAVLHVERLGEPVPPPRLTPDAFADKLELAASFLTFVAQTCVSMYEGTTANTNRITGAPGQAHVDAQDDEVDTHCSTEMLYMGGRWKIEDDTALIVTIKRPPADFMYWGLVLVNPWAESYDYRYAPTCTNNHRATASPNGDWRIVIAARDPSVPNWLDTGGRLEGQMLLRWVLAPNSTQNPECAVVPLDRVSSVL